jgi:hypothetical protein
MKLLSLFFTVLVLASCSSSKKSANTIPVLQVDTSDIAVDSENPVNNDIDFFLKRFEAAAASHNSKRIMSFMDKNYITMMHDEQMGKNTDEFLNKFFSGTGVKSLAPIAIDYKKIRQIKQLESKVFQGYYVLEYRVETDKETVQVNWTLMIAFDNGRNVYGLYGPMQ